MNLEQEIRIMEMQQDNYNLAGFANELDKEISLNEIDETNYAPQTKETSEEIDNVEEQPVQEHSLEEQSPEEQPVEEHSIISEEMPTPIEEKNKPQDNMDDSKRRKILIFGTAAIILIIAIMGIILTNPGGLTGYTIATREIQQTTDFNQTFSQYTETQLELSNIISLKISGKLEGTGAKVKLRINGTDYLVAEIINPNIENLITGQVIGEEALQYTITTDKALYLLGETATITITPDTENKSLYVSYGEQTQKLDTNTYLTQDLGEYQAIALIVLPDNILRLETNFTVSNETTTPIETPLPEPTLQETTGYKFSELCTDTCNIPENSNPILIIETEGNSTLTITQITTTQQKENNAPVQIKAIQGINLITGQATTLDLNEYFSDTDGDTIQYDINEIPEIDATISQNILTIASANLGVYTAYIYATDGDKLVTSNTFNVIITAAETENPDNQTTPTNETLNETTNITVNETPATPITNESTTGSCSNPDMNLRPSACFAGLENTAFESLALPLQDKQRANVGVFTRFGNLIIRGLLTQDATGNPKENDFQIGFTETSGFSETNTMTAWIDSETGNLYLKGKIYENQEILNPSQYNTLVMRNKFGLILGYFDQLKGELYLRGNIVQLGRI